MITNDARCTREIKSRITILKAEFNKKKTLFTSKRDLNLRKKLVKCYIWSIALCGAEMWCWRRMEISWTDRVRNEVLHGVKEERNIVHTIKRRKANWIGHILRRNCLLKHVIGHILRRNCPLKHVIEGKLERRI
jgi:hypothetical protein